MPYLLLPGKALYPRDTRSSVVGLRSPRQLALDGGQVEADDPLAAYLDDRHAHLAGLLLDRAGCRRVALDVDLPEGDAALLEILLYPLSYPLISPLCVSAQKWAAEET